MREIKFRAWDKSEQVMGEVTRLDENIYVEFKVRIKPVESCLHCPNNKCWHPHKYIKTRGNQRTAKVEIEIIQYTGLKDKNGKEIYEGDIVRIGNLNKKVFMRLGCWFVEMGKELGYYGSENIEVIGNIYENKELLDA